MNRSILKITVLLIIVSAMLLYPQRVGARAPRPLGDTLEENSINRYILKSDDEYDVVTYLSDTYASVRMTACMRLGVIGTSHSLSFLEDLANNDEDNSVRQEASLALWMIRYREDIASGGDGESVLLQAANMYEAINIDEFIDFEIDAGPFIAINGYWATGRWEGVYGVYLPYSPAGKNVALMDGVALKEGTIEFIFKINYQHSGPEEDYACPYVYFGVDNEKKGYAAFVEYTDGDCWVGLFEAEDYEVWMDDPNNERFRISVDLPESFDSTSTTTPHTLKVEIVGTQVKVYVDDTLYIDEQVEGYKQGKIALSAWSDIGYLWFDDVGVQGTGLVRDYSDKSKTPRVAAWAMELLGDIGSQAALELLEAIIVDLERTPSTGYLKRIAHENLKKIEFLMDPNTTDPIGQGLVHPELCIRELAIRMLVNQNPEDLLERLETLLQEALSNNDHDFASYIAATIEEVIKKKEMTPFIEIGYPEDGATIKAAEADISGYTHQGPFFDLLGLTPGENTYTKEVTDEDGNVILSKSITIYHENSPPVLNKIGPKSVLVGQTLVITVSGHDPDDTDLRYAAYDLPVEAVSVFDEATSSWISTWIPMDKDIGTHTVRFKVEDPYHLRDEEEILITVMDTQPVLSIEIQGENPWVLGNIKPGGPIKRNLDDAGNVIHKIANIGDVDVGVRVEYMPHVLNEEIHPGLERGENTFITLVGELVLPPNTALKMLGGDFPPGATAEVPLGYGSPTILSPKDSVGHEYGLQFIASEPIIDIP